MKFILPNYCDNKPPSEPCLSMIFSDFKRLFPSFKPLFCLLLIISCFLLIPARAKCRQTEAHQLAIITSYPPDFYEPFLTRFKALYPELQVSILNKKTTAALAEIRQGNNRHFDLFWSSSPDAFMILKTSEMLKKITRSDNSSGYFFSFALSSVGWMWNNRLLNKEGLPSPTSWSDLADPAYYGHLAMSTPSRSGTTHLIVESILQGLGWDEGWALLTRMAGNFTTITARSFSVPDGVKGGRFGIGLVIDFLAYAQKSIDADIDFRYGKPAFLLPAGIGALKNSRNPQEAVLFIDFILSPEGQEILLAPGINRLPIMYEIFKDKQLKLPDLYQLIEQNKPHSYDIYLSQKRYNLVNQLFDQMITYKLLERRRIWKRLIQLESISDLNNSSFIDFRNQVLKLLCQVPITEEQSRDQKLNKMFSLGLRRVPTSPEQKQLTRQWEKFIDNRLAKAKNLIDKKFLSITP